MEEVPPTCFVIKPHHIQNLMIIGVVFQEFKNHKIPPQFMIHVYRLLMQEIAEVSPRQYAFFRGFLFSDI
jgi:anaphase-promoting complex subunit 5